jgi:succinyl-diaminopimelate desuccinylase
MTRIDERAAALAEAAREDHPSVLELARELVRIPSRGGIDAYDPVLDCMSSWLRRRGLQCRRLTGPGGATVALACEVTGAGAGPRYVLEACLDTAPFGDESAWELPPTSGEVSGGWLHGRGSSDSKAGAAIFAHVLARLQSHADRWAGSVVLLLDVDEHTGAFGGARAFFEDPAGPRVDGVLIGYPGSDHGITAGAKIAGPSNIGNYLAGLGIPATAGFGVAYQGLHGTDERIRVDTIPPVQAAYHQALLSLLPHA